METVFGVIHPPQVAMVGFGTTLDRPWAIDGLLGVRPVVMASLSADHRVSDGHRGARFLAALGDLLRRPGDPMTPDAIRESVRRVLHSIAPEADLDSVGPGTDFPRAQLDLDSMDFLRFITGLHAELGVEVPEADYGRLRTLDGCVSYIAAHAPAATTP